MDPLTHGLLGAACGQALFARRLGGRALVVGAVAAMAPDVDVVMNATGPFAEWTWHRGVTHALWLGPLAGALAAFPLSRRYGGGRRAWTLLVALAMLSHSLLDAFTTYGTQLLAPLSSRRFAWDGVAIIDPAYTLVLAAALLVGALAGAASPRSGLTARAAVALTTAYLLLGVWLNHRVEREAAGQLAASGLHVERVSAYPTLLQLPFRRVVAHGGGIVRVGWVSALAPGPIEWEAFAEARGPLVEAARRAPEARLFEWFAMGEVAARLTADPHGGGAVELDDLRYGVPGRPRDGLWGVRVRVDPDGTVTSRERIARPLPGGRVALLRELWRRTLGG